MAIDLNKPEFIKYRKAVEYNVKNKNNFVFKNDGIEKALIVFGSIFRNANSSIQIVAKSLNNDLTNDDEYIRALRSFLDKADAKLDILVSEYNKKNNDCDLFKIFHYCPTKI